MTDREKLIELLKAADRYEFEETRNSGVYDREAAWGYIADHLLANGVTFASAVPGPSDADPNIMELCFHNGENHMRDKIKNSILKLSADMPCVPISQVIKMMEDM